MADNKSKDYDIFDTALDDPIVMGGLGALGGNLIGRRVGKRLLDKHRWTRAEHEATDANRAYADDVYDRRYADDIIDRDERAFEASQRSMKRREDLHPKKIVPVYAGTIGGGAGGAAYATGRSDKTGKKR